MTKKTKTPALDDMQAFHVPAPVLGEIRHLPSWESLRGGGYEVPLDEALNIIDKFKAKVSELEAENRAITEEIEGDLSPTLSTAERKVAELEAQLRQERDAHAATQTKLLVTTESHARLLAIGHDLEAQIAHLQAAVGRAVEEYRKLGILRGQTIVNLAALATCPAPEEEK